MNLPRFIGPPRNGGPHSRRGGLLGRARTVWALGRRFCPCYCPLAASTIRWLFQEEFDAIPQSAALGSDVLRLCARGVRPGAGAPESLPQGPPLLFRESWLQPPGAKPVGQGDGTDDVVTRLTAANLPIVVANKRLELRVYGKDGYLVRTAQHYGRNDLWTGMATTPVAITLRDKANYLDLTGLARVRWIVRTNSVSLLHPVVKLADGTYIVARRAIETGGEFL